MEFPIEAVAGLTVDWQLGEEEQIDQANELADLLSDTQGVDFVKEASSLRSDAVTSTRDVTFEIYSPRGLNRFGNELMNDFGWVKEFDGVRSTHIDPQVYEEWREHGIELSQIPIAPNEKTVAEHLEETSGVKESLSL